MIDTESAFVSAWGFHIPPRLHAIETSRTWSCLYPRNMLMTNLPTQIFVPNSKGKMTCTVRLQTSYVTIGRKKCREGPNSCNLATTLEEFYSTQYSIVREWSTNQILPSIWEGILEFCSFSNEGVISNSAIDRQRAFPSLYADHDLTTAFLHLRSPSDIWTHLRTPWASPAHSKKLLKENLYWRCS
jgi:hypothetical protein